MDFLMFVMVAALFIHTFLNFFMGVYTAAKTKLSAAVGTEVASALSSVEQFFGSAVAAVVKFFKGL
jgi:hypothetical protein